MGLAIGVHKGDKVYLNDTPLEVLELQGYEGARVRVGERMFTLSDRENTEVMPSVFVCCGSPVLREVVVRDRDTGEEEIIEPQSRLTFDAPPSIKILRESLYLKRHARETI